MDNACGQLDDQGLDVDNLRTTWGPHPAVLWTAGGLTLAFVAAAVWFGVTGDGPGCLLVGLVAVLTGLGTGYGVLVRPRLAADAAGIDVRHLRGVRRAQWREASVRLETTRRLRRDVATLELDLDDGHLVVLGWLELGAHPGDVHAELERLRPADASGA